MAHGQPHQLALFTVEILNRNILPLAGLASLREDNLFRKIFTSLLATILLDTVPITSTQQPGKIPWIGYLAGAGSGPSPAFTQRLRDLSYVEGKNLGFVFRTTEGNAELWPGLAAELVRLTVDVIVADARERSWRPRKPPARSLSS